MQQPVVVYNVQAIPSVRDIFCFKLIRPYPHFSSSILLIKVPTPCETKTLNSSPSFSIRRGLAFQPTPGGVLVVSTYHDP